MELSGIVQFLLPLLTPMLLLRSWFPRWSRQQGFDAAATPVEPHLWRPVIWAITNVFETGLAEGDPGALQIADGGLISYGRHQATLVAGTLAQVIERYGLLSQSPTAAAFQPWMPRLQAKDPALRQETTFLQLLRAAAADPAMSAAQDDIFDQHYYQPAIQRAREYHLHTPFALACLYDTGVQGGRDRILARLSPKGEDSEARWLARFLDERERWVKEVASVAAANGQTEQARYLRNSLFRVKELRRLLRQGNMGLRGRIRLRGQTIHGLPPKNP